MEYEFDQFTKKKIVGIHRESPKETPIISNLDVLVVGGSASGVAAAISASRVGAKVLLVERFGFLGGQSVFSLVTQWEKRAFINNLGAVATRGIAKEMLDRIVAKGNSDGLWKTPPGCEEMRDGEEWLDPEDIKYVLMEMCQEAGVDLLFHTMAVDVIMVPKENNERIPLPRMTGVIFENKTGRFGYWADTIVDATADIDLVWRAIRDEGVEMIPPTERIGAGFYVYYGGIDSSRFVEYTLQQDDIKSYPSKNNKDKIRKHFAEEKLILFSGFEEILEKAEEEGYFDELEEILEREEIVIMLNLGMKWVGKDRWCLHLSQLGGLNLLDTWEVTKYETVRTRLEHIGLKIVRLIPGWEEAYIDRTNLHIGSRQTRTLKAKYMLTKKDILDPDHEREEVIGRSGAHDPGKNKLKSAYPIPYGILVPEKLDGVMVCARAVGCKDQLAINAHRGITPGIVVGQAAGVSAAISVKSKKSPHNLDINEVQKVLRASDVVLDKEIVDLNVNIKDSDKIKL